MNDVSQLVSVAPGGLRVSQWGIELKAVSRENHDVYLNVTTCFCCVNLVKYSWCLNLTEKKKIIIIRPILKKKKSPLWDTNTSLLGASHGCSPLGHDIVLAPLDL